MNGQLSADNPFDLGDSGAYEQWKQRKLKDYPSEIEALVVKLDNPYSLQPSEIKAITEHCAQCGLAIYQLEDAAHNNKDMVHALGVN